MGTVNLLIITLEIIFPEQVVHILLTCHHLYLQFITTSHQSPENTF